MAKGTLYLVPVALGDTPWQTFLPPQVRDLVLSLDYFVVEDPKSARLALKRLGVERALQEIEIRALPRSPAPDTLPSLIEPVLHGRSAGLMSEAGCPAVADPGAALVRLAHQHGVRVVPLVGPSSLLLALIASGLNGQSFAFQGYLPVKDPERRRRIEELERESQRRHRTQILIETPYRNQALFSALLQTCQPATLLCVARELTLPDEFVATQTVADWRRHPAPELHRRPTVFLLLAGELSSAHAET